MAEGVVDGVEAVGGGAKRARALMRAEGANPVVELMAEDAPRFGPAMQALPEPWRIFVWALCSSSKMSGARAYRMAGYSGKTATCSAGAQRLKADPRVQAAIVEEAKRTLIANAGAAVAVVGETLANSRAATRDRLKAAEMVFDRAGMHAKTEQVAPAETPASRREKLLQLVLLARALGQDPRALVGQLADVTEEDVAGVAPAIDAREEEPVALPPADG